MQQLQQLDRLHHIHPVTNHAVMHKAGTHIITSGEGVWVIDENGRKLLDGMAGLWCVSAGYSCDAITDAITRQLKKLPFYTSFMNSTSDTAIRLAEKLAQIAPTGLNHVFFSGSGSEANESALKIIRTYFRQKGKPGKTKILSRKYAYHGVTWATGSMTGLPVFHEGLGFPLPGFLHAPAPYTYAANTHMDPQAYGNWCLRETAKLIESEGPDTIAAIFAEPIQGAGGVIVPPQGYLQGLRNLAREYDLLYVSDEVITGFGRVGDWFASSAWNLEPDILVTAKGLTSGYVPLGATLVSDSIAQTIIDCGVFPHGFTYSGHPVCCAAALANIDFIASENLIPLVRDDTGPYFEQKMHALTKHRAVGDVRVCKLIGALELVPKGGRAALSPTAPIGAKAADLVREEGAIVRAIKDSIAICPPLIITRDEINILFAAIERALDRLWD
jgi:putrescine aminotransferase